MRKLFNEDNLSKTLISIAFTLLTIVLAVNMASQKSSGETGEIIKQHTKDIEEIKSCADKKVDKGLYDYSLQQLDKRLTNIEQSQEDIKLILITKK